MSERSSKLRPPLQDHLFRPGPKRILALDGGGTLGVIELAFLEKIEKLLQDQHNDPGLRLCDYFDLIGGTSTGALIATALAMGMSAKEVRELYVAMAPRIFKKRWFHVPGIHTLVRYPFRARALSLAVTEIVRERTLESVDLLTGLALVAKRLDTASPWVLTNNPKATYWKYDPSVHKKPFIDNRTFKLKELLRASTAAPLTFIPKEIPIAKRLLDAEGKPIGEEDEIGYFVDGGLSPHNNPAMKLLMVAGIKKYGFGWPLGANAIHVVSIGTGWFRPRIKPKLINRMFAFRSAAKGARGAIWDSQVHALTQLQWMSDPQRSWNINSEIGDLAGDVITVDGMQAGGLLSFQRYDVNLDMDWLQEEIPDAPVMRTLTKANLEKLTRDSAFTDPEIMALAGQLADAVAEKHVSAEHFPAAFRLGHSHPTGQELQRPKTGQAMDESEEPKGKPIGAPFIVGIVGHRPNRLPPDDMTRITAQLDAALAEIQGTRPVESMVLLTGLAEGTDQIAARMALARNWSLVGSLPFSKSEYCKDFQTPTALADLHALLQRASRVIEAPQADAFTDRNQGYAEQGQGLAAAADAVVTVWDGQGAHGVGGTADVVAAAIARGTRVYWINTDAGAALKRL